jgi:hypothetical protein
VTLRPFDDGRFPDLEGFADCFLCGRKVDPMDDKRGTYEEPPAGPLLPIHIPCLHGRNSLSVALEYHKALNEMSDRSIVVARGH